MIRNRWWSSALLLVVLAPGPPAWAQAAAYQERIWRDQAVAAVGPIARDMVESHGSVSCRALFACSRPMAINLCQFHNCGGLARLPRPDGVLRAIALHGDVAAWYVMQHPELQDMDNCDAFCLAPADYALNIRPLEAGAAEVRARRLNTQSGMPAWGSRLGQRTVAGASGLVLIVLAVCWWKRRRQSFAAA
jgi:hypothetical protein